MPTPATMSFAAITDHVGNRSREADVDVKVRDVVLDDGVPAAVDPDLSIFRPWSLSCVGIVAHIVRQAHEPFGL